MRERERELSILVALSICTKQLVKPHQAVLVFRQYNPRVVRIKLQQKATIKPVVNLGAKH